MISHFRNECYLWWHDHDRRNRHLVSVFVLIMAIVAFNWWVESIAGR